jgi:hypothetical protein
VWALQRPLPARRALAADTPVGLIAVLVAGAAVAGGLRAVGLAGDTLARAAFITAAHGSLLGTALAWGAARGPDGRTARWPAWGAVTLLALGALVGGQGGPAALAYAAPAVWVFALGARGWLPGLPLGHGGPLRGLLAGLVVGTLLGAHVLLSALRTLGYQPAVGDPDRLLAALGYDLGANVLAAECFFRGALFERARRRWTFAVAAAVATGAALVRYQVDPLLPPTLEIRIGAVFYLSLLGVANCVLLARFGTLSPGYAASLGVFAAYRVLGGQ